MLCAVCNERKASIHLTQVIDGIVTKYDMCEVCGKDLTAAVESAQGNADYASRFPQMPALLADFVIRNPRYPKEAYAFVLAGSGKALEALARSSRKPAWNISAAQLLEALRDHALDTYGAQARSVLNSWGIFECADFGEIVFNLIEIGLLSKRPDESKSDFIPGFNFDEAFPL